MAASEQKLQGVHLISCFIPYNVVIFLISAGSASGNEGNADPLSVENIFLLKKKNQYLLNERPVYI